METYKFTYNSKTYELGEDNCSDLVNYEERPVTGFDISDVLALLSQQEEVSFSTEYYDQPCESCLAGKAEKAKFFPFLDYHFYIYTNKGQFVISSISKDIEKISINKLLQSRDIDNSYIASVLVCANCGEYSIEIDQCEV